MSAFQLFSSSRRWPRRLLWLAAFCFLLSVFCFAFRAPLLAGFARWWVVDGPVSKADAIMVLGGGVPRRPIEAARLYQAGLAPKVLYSDVTTNQIAQLGMDKPETTLTREVLIRQGVPESALECLGHGVSSTYLESLAVRDWVRQTGAKSVIIPTDEFHTRRVRWVFRKALRPTGARLQIKPVVHPDFTTTNWWWKEEGVVALQNEVLKYLYYRLKY
jgi:uncharacterized SAM-binding protein YcdF (DUF218 family)